MHDGKIRWDTDEYSAVFRHSDWAFSMGGYNKIVFHLTIWSYMLLVTAHHYVHLQDPSPDRYGLRMTQVGAGTVSRDFAEYVTQVFDVLILFSRPYNI